MLNFCLINAVNNFDKKAEMCNKKQTNTEKYYPIYYYNWLWTWFKLRQIVKSGKATSMTYVNLAELYEQLFMYKKAKKYVLKAIRKDKNNAFAYCELGILIDDDSISKKYFLKSLDIGSEYDFVSLFSLLLIYFRENDWDKVFDYAREYLNSKTDSPSYWVLAVLIYTIFENAVTPFCEIYTLLKNKKLSLAAFVECIIYMLVLLLILFVLNTVSVWCRYFFGSLRGAYLLHTGQDEAAEKIFFKLTKKYKEFREHSYMFLLDYYYKNKHYKKCINAANRILIKDSNSWVAYLLKGRSLEALKYWDEAAKVYEQALEIFPNDVMYYRSAFVGGVIGDFEAALAKVNKSLLLKKDYCAYKLKAELLTCLNRFKEAELCYKKAEEYKEE